MVLANAIRDKSHSCAVVAATPKRAIGAQTSGKSLVNFRVCKGLRFAVVPSKTPKCSEIAREALLKGDAKAVLAGYVPRVIGDVRPCNKTLPELGYRVAINPHVCIVRESKDSDHSRFAR